MKFTGYFHMVSQRPDRAMIREDWIRQAVEHPEREQTQEDGRIRR